MVEKSNADSPGHECNDLQAEALAHATHQEKLQWAVSLPGMQILFEASVSIL